MQARVLFRYHGENPNGSLRDIAGIMNPMGNVLGMMPHPERASDALLGRNRRQLHLAVDHRALGLT